MNATYSITESLRIAEAYSKMCCEAGAPTPTPTPPPPPPPTPTPSPAPAPRLPGGIDPELAARAAIVDDLSKGKSSLTDEKLRERLRGLVKEDAGKPRILGVKDVDSIIKGVDDMVDQDAAGWIKSFREQNPGAKVSDADIIKGTKEQWRMMGLVMATDNPNVSYSDEAQQYIGKRVPVLAVRPKAPQQPQTPKAPQPPKAAQPQQPPKPVEPPKKPVFRGTEAQRQSFIRELKGEAPAQSFMEPPRNGEPLPSTIEPGVVSSPNAEFDGLW